MKSTHFIVVWRLGKIVAEHPVKRAVVRVGTDPNSDIVLEGDDLPASALTINFSDPNKIVCYARASVVDSIAGQTPVLNQGIILPVKSEVTFANGYALRAELRELSDTGVDDKPSQDKAPNTAASQDSTPTDTLGRRPRQAANKTEQAVKHGKSSWMFPVVSALVVLSLLAVSALMIQRNNQANSSSRKSADGRPPLFYQSIANQLFGLTDAELKEKPELLAVRDQLQLAQKFRNNSERSQEYLRLARELLRRRLGNEIVAADPPPAFLQSEFDRVSEIQLYQEICKLLY